MNQPPTLAQEKPVSVGDWVLTMIIMGLPLIGFIMMIYWALSDSTTPSKKNYCRACIVLFIIAMVFAMLFLFVFGGLAMLGAASASRGGLH